MKTSESITKIAPALLKAQSAMSNVKKDSKNPFFKSNYADINALRDEAMPALNAAGITVLQPPTTFEGKNYIETILLHESGEFISDLNEIIVSKQNDPQSYLAAQTYTRRGALQAFLSMGAVDDDGNYASGKSDKLENTKIEAKTEPVKTSIVDKFKALAETVEPSKKPTTKFVPKPAAKANNNIDL